MPRKIDPATIPVGSGTAPAGTVEDSSVVRHVKSEDPLRVHIMDPTRAHMAVTTGIVDAGSFYVSEEVEGALQELGALSVTIPLDRQNGWYEAGVQDFAAAVTNVNRTITLAGTWDAVCTTGLFHKGGSSITLPDASTVWVFVHGTTGVLTQQAGVPDITTLEHVIVGRFTCAGNTVTVKDDGRFFLRNDNRKISYSVRSDNAAADANSEGSFYSLQAAFLWLEAYNPSNVSKKTKLVVRGSNTVLSTLVFPIDSLELEGELGASITISGGGPLNLFNLNGKLGLKISKLKLVSNATGSTAITDNAVNVDGLTLDTVAIIAGTGTWTSGVKFTSASQAGVLITSSQIDVAGANALAVSMKSPSRVSIVQSKISFTGGGGGPSSGILLGDKAGGGALGTMCSVVQSMLTGFITVGIQIYNTTFELRANRMNMSGASAQGIQVSGGSIGGSIAENEVFGTHQISYNITGLNNVTDKTFDISVEGNRAFGSGTQGVYFNGYVQNSRIVDNVVDGWLGGGEVTATGIQLSTNVDSCPGNVQVSGNTVTRCSDGISVIGLYDTRAKADITITNFANLVAGVSNIIIGGVAILAVAGAPGINQFQIGGSNNATAANLQAAINNPSNGFYADIVHASVSTNVVTVYAVAPGNLGNGMTVTNNAPTAVTTANLANGQTRSIEGVIIDSNVVTNCARSKAAAGPDTFVGTANKGIGLDHTFGCKISNNDVREIGIMVDASGNPSIPSALGTVLESIGIYSRNSSRVQILGNAVYNCARNNAGAAGAAARGIVSYQGSSGVEPFFIYYGTGLTIANNLVTWENRGNGGKLKISGQIGIDLYCDLGTDVTSSSHLQNDVRVTGNQVVLAQIAGLRFVLGNLVQFSEFIVSGNQASNCGNGASSGGIVFALSNAAGAIGGKTLILNGIVDGNTVDASAGDGISILGTRSVGPNEISNLKFSKNKIRMSNRASINMALAVNVLAFTEIEVTENQILNAGTGGAYSGIYIESTDTGISAFRRVRVQRNNVVGGLNATVPAVYVHVVGIAPSQIHLDENVIEAADGTASPGSGISMSVTGNDFGISRSSFSRNKIYTNTDGLKVACTSTPIQLSFDGNQIEVDDNDSRPLWFVVSRTTVAGELIGRHFSVMGNILRGGRGSLFHSIGGMKIGNLTVSGNHFVEVDNNTATTWGDSAGFCFAVDTAAGLGASTNPTVRDILIEGNVFQNCQQEGLVVNLGPGIAGSAFTSSGIGTGVLVRGNSFARTALAFDGGSFLLKGTAAALRVVSCMTLRNLAVDDNSFQDCGATGATSSVLGVIQIDFISNESVSLINSSVSGNAIDGSVFAFIKVKNLVKNVNCPYANIRGLRVSGNQAAGLSKALFWADLATASQDYVLENISIEGNVANLITGGQNGILFDTDGDVSGLSFYRNKTSGTHATSIKLHGLVGSNVLRTWKDISFEGNSLSDFTVQGIYQQIEAGAGDTDLRNDKFADNLFYSTGDGVMALRLYTYSFHATGTWDGLQVSDNMARISDQGAIFASLESNLVGATKRCFSFTGNNLIGVGKAGAITGPAVWAGVDKLVTLAVVGNSMDLAVTTWGAFAALFNAPAIIAVGNNAN